MLVSASLHGEPQGDGGLHHGVEEVKQQRRWWKEAIVRYNWVAAPVASRFTVQWEDEVYQIYVRSFYDSNGDGIGDIPGITQKLDYLKELGIDVIWLTPCYTSPNFDNGYDVADYRRINEESGTMKDWETLLDEVHKRGMKLIMDLVVNHTSHLHHWFIESRKSTDNEYRDYYYWREGKDGREPNNWGAIFGGPAWKYDPTTKCYFLHTFSEHQPDLNWDNPRVREEVFDMMHFWFEKGIDGFRMDVINHISKVPELPDAPITVKDRAYQPAFQFFVDGPKVHDYIREMNEKVLSKYDCMSVGEMPMTDVETALKYVAEDRKELNLIFQFEHVDIDSRPGHKWAFNDWRLRDFKSIIKKWQQGLYPSGWNSFYFCNHDQPRSISRYGNDSHRYRVKSGKLLATMLLTHLGTPFIYQGEEIGMTNVMFEDIDEYKDIETLKFYDYQVNHIHQSVHEVMECVHRKSRDNARTPMQWTGQSNAGFTTGTPWLSVNPNYKIVNVRRESANPGSILNYYKKIIQIRKQNPVLIYGEYVQILEKHESIYAYLRKLEDKVALVINNFYECFSTFMMPEAMRFTKQELLIANYDNTDGQAPLQEIELRPQPLAGAGALVLVSSGAYVMLRRHLLRKANQKLGGEASVAGVGAAGPSFNPAMIPFGNAGMKIPGNPHETSMGMPMQSVLSTMGRSLPTQANTLAQSNTLNFAQNGWTSMSLPTQTRTLAQTNTMAFTQAGGWNGNTNHTTTMARTQTQGLFAGGNTITIMPRATLAFDTAKLGQNGRDQV